MELYDLAVEIKKADGDTVKIKKAVADYENSGSTAITDGVNLFDTVRAENEIVKRMRIIPLDSNTAYLNQFVTTGVLVGRANAGVAKQALIAGNAISGTTKKNIGNQANLKELYFLVDLSTTEMTNLARLGRNEFNKKVGEQFAISYQNKLDEMFFTGDNSADQPYSMFDQLKANLAANQADIDSGVKVRNVDFNPLGVPVTSMIERFRLVRDAHAQKYRAESVYIVSQTDYDKYVDEVDATTNHNGMGDITKSKKYKFDGKEVIPSVFCPDDHIHLSPLNNMALCVSVMGIERGTEKMNVPKSLLYYVTASWNFHYITYDKVTIGYFITP